MVAERDTHDKATFYRSKASECRAVAEQQTSKDMQVRYLELAAQWDDLAQQVDKR